MMYDRLKQLVLEAALPPSAAGNPTSNKPSSNLPAELGGNPALRARLLANLRASRAARVSSNFDTFSRSQDAIADYRAKEAEKKKLAAQEKIGGAVKALGAGALVGNALSKMQNLQGATKRKAAPGSLV